MPRIPASSALPSPRRLNAGLLTLDFSPAAGDLRYVRTPALELIRRVYFVARDCNWLNVPQRLSRPRIRVTSGGFGVTASGRSSGPGVKLAWELRLHGTADGRITFSVEGRALADCLVSRVGLCVHLPLQGFAGARGELVTSAGVRSRLVLPGDVAPHQTCTAIRELHLQLPRRHRLGLSFAGDEFEMEDQRNWIDGSFKIYSRPLSLPYPYTIKAGDSFVQSLAMRVLAPRAATKVRRAGGIRHSSASSAVTVRVGKTLPHPAPAIGLGLPSDLGHASASEAAALQALGLAHVRADFDDFGPGLKVRAQKAMAASAQLGARLELAVSPSMEDPARDLATLARSLQVARARIARVLVYAPLGRCTDSPSSLAAARRSFGPACAVGTAFNFAELNRGRTRLPAAAAYTFSANPQVHASDEQSIAECLEGLRHCLNSAQRYFPGAAVGVSRLTLRPQKNVVANRPSKDDEARRFDPRQSSAWCAAWTVGALGALQEEGAAWATLFETTGRGGVVTGRQVFPVHRALADYLGCGNAAPRGLEISAPLQVAGWARDGRLALANLTTGPVRVAVGRRIVRLPAHGYTCLPLSTSLSL